MQPVDPNNSMPYLAECPDFTDLEILADIASQSKKMEVSVTCPRPDLALLRYLLNKRMVKPKKNDDLTNTEALINFLKKNSSLNHEIQKIVLNPLHFHIIKKQEQDKKRS